jgi:protein-disulfide isomerase
VEFYDYDCPYCRVSLPAVKKFYEANKDHVRFSFIEFPIKHCMVKARCRPPGPPWRHGVSPDRYMDFHFALLGQEERR